MENIKLTNENDKSFWAAIFDRLKKALFYPATPISSEFNSWNLPGDVLDKHWRYSLSRRGFERAGIL